MNEFELSLMRLKQQLGVSEDQAVAELLGMKKAAFSSRKKRNAFPEDALRELAEKKPELNLDVQFILNGTLVVAEAKRSPLNAVKVDSQLASYKANIRDALWMDVLEAVIDRLNEMGKRVSGEKVVAVTDLVTEYCRDKGLDREAVDKHLRLVA